MCVCVCVCARQCFGSHRQEFATQKTGNEGWPVEDTAGPEGTVDQPDLPFPLQVPEETFHSSWRQLFTGCSREPTGNT